MATFTSHQTQNHCVSKLLTNKPITEKNMFTRVRTSYPESAPPVAVVGMTGAVGQEFLSVLSDRDFPYRSIKMLASKRSAGKQLSFQDKAYTVEELTEDSFDGVEIALFSAGGSVSKNFGPVTVEKGSIFVDNSSAFRMVESAPLGIPEVNPEAMSGIKVGMGKVALMAATPLFHRAKVTPMVVSAYQAATGAGAASMEKLELQTREVLEGKPPTCKIFSPQHAFSLFSDNAPVLENGHNEEEMKMVKETRNIWNDNNVRVTATCLQVPVMRAHAQRGPGGSVTAEAADNSRGPVTGSPIDVVFIPQYPSDINVMKDAIVFLCQNCISCQVIEFSTKGQCMKKLSDNGRSVIIASDHGAGEFLDKIALCTSGVVIGLPMRASEVSGVPASFLGTSPGLPIMLVGANDAMEAAKLAVRILAFGHPEEGLGSLLVQV